METKEKFKINWALLVGGIIIALLGLILMVFHNESWLIRVVQILIGVVVIAVNGTNIYALISKGTKDVTYSKRLFGFILNIIIGLFLIIAFNDTFRTVVLIVMIVIPIIEIIFFGKIPGIIGSSLMQIFLGIIVLILGANGIMNLVFIIVGGIMFVTGVFNILSAFSVIRYKRHP